MKISLSAFAFSPVWGSEPGVGWNCAATLSQEHEVTVLTHRFFRNHMSRAEATKTLSRFKVVYLHAAPPLFGRFHEQLLSNQPCYLWRQLHAFGAARKLLLRDTFDLVHRITWGSFRLPSFLPWLKRPFIFGPVGGGARAPLRLFAGLPVREHAREWARNAAIYSNWLDPSLRLSLSRSPMIWCKTPESLQTLPPGLRSKARVVQEIGAPPGADGTRIKRRQEGAPLELLFAGRRLLALEGIHLALRAMAVAKQRGLVAQLTLLGEGSIEGHLKQLAATQRLADQVQFTGKVHREAVMARYHEADVFLFPSLHDSGGTVVLEALSRGLPVICVDLGGPQYFLNPECGFVVAAQSACANEVIEALAGMLLKIAAMPAEQLQSMRQAVLQQAQAMDWPAQVHHAYEQIAKQIGVRP